MRRPLLHRLPLYDRVTRKVDALAPSAKIIHIDIDTASIFRMTLKLTRSDELFEQIKKQLNGCVGIIKVLGFRDLIIEI